MINSEEFSKRLKKIFDYYELSASSFADKIDVGRASISHILSGRNKPSLDFVMRVVSTFDEVELYWLLNGKGSFPPLLQDDTETLNDHDKQQIDTPGLADVLPDSEVIKDNIHFSTEYKETVSPKASISKVIIFYSDGSFESYENSPKT